MYITYINIYFSLILTYYLNHDKTVSFGRPLYDFLVVVGKRKRAAHTACHKYSVSL